MPLARLTVLASEVEIGDLERDGLWLIAVGALIVGLSLFAQGPQRGLTGRPVGSAAPTATGSCLPPASPARCSSRSAACWS